MLLKNAQAMPSAIPPPTAAPPARRNVVACMLYVGMRRTFAHSRQRAPTGVWTRQRGQIGLPQRLHDSSVSTLGWVAHCMRRSPDSNVGAARHPAPEAYREE